MKMSAILTVTAALITVVGACKQPEPTCGTAQGDFFVRYRLVSGKPSCFARKGEILGIHTYSGLGKDGQPTFDTIALAVRPARLGEHWERALAAEGAGVASVTSERLNAHGTFASTEPTGAGFCAARTLSPIDVALPAVAAVAADPADPTSVALPELAPLTSRYVFRSLRTYVTASTYGTQLDGEVEITDDGVTCVYALLGVYPAVPCAAVDPEHPDAPPTPDDAACSSEADPAAGRPIGSGIGPDLAVRCDPDLLTCALAREAVPSFR